jgi:type II secretory pathway pseudopilin PulG
MNQLQRKNTGRALRSFSEEGFTLMEIVVATTIFSFVAIAIMALFVYTLQIHRKGEAIRQATQGMRNLAEFIVREVRNGQIDYSVSGGKVIPSLGNCPSPQTSYGLTAGSDNRNDVPGSGGRIYGQSDTTTGTDNTLGIVTTEGERECIYLVQADGSYNKNLLSGSKLRVRKGGKDYDLTPENFYVEYAAFRVRPLQDPYTVTPAGSNPRTQPLVSMVLRFRATLKTGETVPIYYQTTVSSDKYDIPSQ